ncbi:hypothetical protein HAX54_049407, partial [Datura stramonium]|nr:hypothetical protein [Datura stramonium]
MAPKSRKGEGVILQAMEQKGQEWVKKHNMRMLACCNNHRGDVESVRSRSKESLIWTCKFSPEDELGIDEQLQQLSMDYPMSELSHRESCGRVLKLLSRPRAVDGGSEEGQRLSTDHESQDDSWYPVMSRSKTRCLEFQRTWEKGLPCDEWIPRVIVR